MTRLIIPGTTLSTVANLKRGDVAGLFPYTTDMCMIRRVKPAPRDGVYVTYRWSPAGRLHRIRMPAKNTVQIGL
jgi:hypothetical protein